MRRTSLLHVLAILGALLLCSSAWAALSGGELQKWHQAQQMAQCGDQVQAQQLTQVQMSEMQHLLTMHGYDVSDVAGVYNEETKRAICDFQAANGLTITGAPNAETLRALAPSSEQMEFFGLSPEFGNTEYDNSNCCP